jgi:hypothetical protein
MKEKAIQIIKNSSIFLLLVMILVLVITACLFFVKVTITPYHLPIIYIVAIGIYIGFNKKEDWKMKLSGLILGTLVLFISLFIFSNIYDATGDGNTYHKLAIGSMKNGWNPVYESSKDFKIQDGNVFDPSDENMNTLWVDHYTKGTEIFAAVIYAFTGNIESGKIYTAIFMYIVFGILFSYLAEHKKMNMVASFAIATLLAVNPITLVQMGNYYIDASLGLMLYLIFYSMIVQCDDTVKIDKKETLFIMASAIIWGINIKLTGIVFVALFCVVGYFYLLYKKYKEGKEVFLKELKIQTIFYVGVVILSVVIVGYTSYFKNMLFFGHPLYPLYGEEAVENIGTKEAPKSFAEKNRLETFLISIFSKGENVSASHYEGDNPIVPKWKVPFTVTKEEIENYNIPDIRMSGFGPLFSGIFILTIIGTIYIIISLIRKKKYKVLIPYLLLLATMAFIILIFDGNYWARYITFIYVMPMIVLYDLLKNTKNKMKTILGILFTIIIALNTAFIAKISLSNIRITSREIKARLQEFKNYSMENEKVEIKLNDIVYQSILYNLDDKQIHNYTVNQEKEGEREIYFSKY